MEFREKILEAYNVKLPIKGGNGTCIESPIIIDISQKYNYVSLEKICINYACQIIGMEWVMEKQELIDLDGKWIDVIIIGVSTNGDFKDNYKQTSYYFDISNYINYTLNRAEFNKLW